MDLQVLVSYYLLSLKSSNLFKSFCGIAYPNLPQFSKIEINSVNVRNANIVSSSMEASRGTACSARFPEAIKPKYTAILPAVINTFRDCISIFLWYAFRIAVKKSKMIRISRANSPISWAVSKKKANIVYIMARNAFNPAKCSNEFQIFVMVSIKPLSMIYIITHYAFNLINGAYDELLNVIALDGLNVAGSVEAVTV